MVGVAYGGFSMREYVFGLMAVCAVLSAPAAAAIFVDDFDDYSTTSQEHWDGSGRWTTALGVDLVKSGDYSLTCAGAAGSCIDLSGTSAGFMTTTLDLAAGTYLLSFDYTGNQLGAQYPTANFQVTAGSLDMTIGPLASTSAIFTTYTGLFSVGSSGPVALTFRQLAGGDPFRGSILDNVVISAVPEPATWAMMLTGLGVVGMTLRRRSRNRFSRIAFS